MSFICTQDGAFIYEEVFLFEHLRPDVLEVKQIEIGVRSVNTACVVLCEILVDDQVFVRFLASDGRQDSFEQALAKCLFEAYFFEVERYLLIGHES